ncbi:MAG: glycosyltransferase [Bryobacteraceae bacterium]
MKVPVIVPYAGGHAEVLADELNSFKYIPGHAGDCASKIARILREPGLAARIGSAARRVSEGLSIQAHVYRITSLYEDLLAKAATEQSNRKLHGYHRIAQQ